MASLNKVLLIGNLTRDPEVRYLPSGDPIAEFSVAVNRRYKSKQGEDREEVCFVRVSMFGKRGEVIGRYFKKGSPIFIEGRLRFEEWEKDGKKQSRLSVVAENFEFMESARGRSGGGGETGDGPAPRGRPAVDEGDAPPADGPPAAKGGGDEDDLPF
ncbi:MAG: single-stranded DNA-binding protein [Lentisphaerae bacterium]|nr:single-stranded DNA-binding protein [Lentisphaerota bacterium]